MRNLLNRKTLYEMFRYFIVGGVSAVIDIVGLTFFVEIVFNSEKSATNVAIATAAGFLLGLICNYLLSMLYVFTNEAQKEKNQDRGKTFSIYALVGIIGLLLTELLMYLGMFFCNEEGFWYVLLSCVVKGVVLIWNYMGRKMLVYKGK